MLISYLFLSALAGEEQKCRVLSLSGGGSKGVYEVGVMRAMVNNLTAVEAYYDVVTGVSVGSINAAGFGLFDKEHNELMVDHMEGLWFNLTNSRIWEMWPGHSWNPVYGLFSASGLISN